MSLVRPFAQFARGAAQLLEEEKENGDTVFVELERAEDLKEAGKVGGNRGVTMDVAGKALWVATLDGKLEKWREELFLKVVEPLKYCYDQLSVVGR